MPATTLAAFDRLIEFTLTSPLRPLQLRARMHSTHFNDLRPCAALHAKDKRLAADMLKRFTRKASGFEILHSKTTTLPFDYQASSRTTPQQRAGYHMRGTQ